MLTAALLVSAAVPAAITISASASMAIPTPPSQCVAIANGSSNGVPNYDLPANCTNARIPQTHVCRQVAASNGETAIECADLYFTNSGSSRFIRGGGEYYCQGKWLQCQGMNVTTTMVWQQQGDFTSTMVQPVNYKCNPSPGPACNGNAESGSVVVYTGASAPLQTSGCGPGGCNTCLLGQSFDVADGSSHNGQTWSNVIQVKGGAAATHVTSQIASTKANFCFE